MLKERNDSFWIRIYANWWGIELGKGCSFNGFCKFRRPPGSNIVIGERCRFLSSFSSNLHGINRPCMISTLNRNSSIIIGDNSGFSGSVICSAVSVKIGSRVLCGANTLITDTDSHSLYFSERHPEHFNKKPNQKMENVGMAPVEIKDDVFLGTGVTVLKGVIIGRGTVVGANSVVSKSLPDDVIAFGQPAKVIRKITD